MTLGIAAFLPTSATAAVIVAQYDFTSSSLNSSDTNPDSTASAFGTLGFTSGINVSLGLPAPAVVAYSDGINGPDGTYPNYSIPVNSASDYFYFTVTPVASTFNYEALTLDARLLLAAGGDYVFSLQTSLDNYMSNVATYTIRATDPGATTFQSFSFDLSGFESSAAAQQFRIVLRDQTSSASRGYLFDNVTVTVVPEPSTNALIFGALAAAGVFYRSRRGRVAA